jgi:hypothetical protein
VAGQSRELLQPGLDVVAGDTLAGVDRVEVDRVDHGSVVVDRLGRDRDAEVALGGHDRHPQLALQADLGHGRPQLHHRLAGVTGRQHIGEDGLHPPILS